MLLIFHIYTRGVAIFGENFKEAISICFHTFHSAISLFFAFMFPMSHIIR